jgi:hypothetical protein
MSKERAIKHHILPRSYLERFAQREQIWVLDFELKRQYQINIRDAATIKDFYTAKTVDKDEDDSVEQNYLGKIESLAKSAIDHIIKERTFKDRPQWDILVNFTAQMYTRTPLFRQIILETYDHLLHETAQGMLKDETTFKKRLEEAAVGLQKDMNLTYEQALHVHKHSDTHVDIPRTYYIRLMMEYANDLVPIIGRMTPNLLCVPFGCESRFITGDVPTIPAPRNSNASKMWVGDSNCDLYFPLSSRCCLVLNYDSLRKVNDVSTRRIAFINHLIACNCTRILLSENQSFVWMQENGITSNDPQHLIDSWGPEKKTTLKAKFPDGNPLSACRNDWKLLTSDDKDDRKE